MKNKHIPPAIRNVRVVFPLSLSLRDYMDGKNRRIFPIDRKHNYLNKIFEEHIVLCLIAGHVEISIINCEFKNGLSIRRNVEDDRDYPYLFYMYNSEISGQLTISSYDSNNSVSIDTCGVESLLLTGESEQIDIYRSNFGDYQIGSERCKKYTFVYSSFMTASFAKFRSAPEILEISNDYLAISNWAKFNDFGSIDVSRKESAENYHKLSINSARSISEIRSVKYQLNKSTSSAFAILWGYFFNPFIIIGWMTIIISFFAFMYHFLDHERSVLELLYFSTYTFFTIGYGDIIGSLSIWKVVLVYAEGLLGVLYGAALLTSVINSNTK